jgi:hypothetical protein
MSLAFSAVDKFDPWTARILFRMELLPSSSGKILPPPRLLWLPARSPADLEASLNPAVDGISVSIPDMVELLKDDSVDLKLSGIP